ncbi:MAG: glycosyltransferase family 2 protein [Bifidobacteriaceae bacterium]|nr:glycosyltransferase family 2 protein [Bifidobacteriaceae bacterium]
MQEAVTISIVTHNSVHIFEVLDNLQNQIGNNSLYDVHIYDNNSDPTYVQKLRTYQPFISVHEGKENRGFGYGHNQILHNANTTYAIIFNPDVLVSQEVLHRLFERIKQDNNIAVVSPKVLNEDGSTQYVVRERLDVFDYMLRFIPFKFVKKLFDKRLSRYECRNLPDDKTTDIAMGSGCFMFVNRDKFVEVGGFDERFFMYFEDNDLCMRFGKSGYRIVYTPFETVIHMYEKGAHKSRRLFIVFLQSMVKFFNKWGWKLF